MSDSEAVASMMGRVEAELGVVDVLVNNAGIAIIRGVEKKSLRVEPALRRPG